MLMIWVVLSLFFIDMDGFLGLSSPDGKFRIDHFKTHWGRVTHICVSKLTIICSNNGLSPGRRQAIIWTNAGILLLRPLGTNFNVILLEIHTFSFKKMQLKMSSGKWRTFCLGLNELTWIKAVMNVDGGGVSSPCHHHQWQYQFRYRAHCQMHFWMKAFINIFVFINIECLHYQPNPDFWTGVSWGVHLTIAHIKGRENSSPFSESSVIFQIYHTSILGATSSH